MGCLENKRGQTPLWLAASNGMLKTARLLLEGGVEVDRATTDTGTTPLIQAAFLGHSDLVALLLEHGADVGRHKDDGHTALHRAAQNGHLEVARILLEHGAEVRKESGGLGCVCCKTTPRFQAVAHGHREVAQLLRSKEGCCSRFFCVDFCLLLCLFRCLVSCCCGLQPPD